MIYLASPYSHDSPAVRQQRYEDACQAVVQLLHAGHAAFSPIVHSHPLVSYSLPTDWAFWQRVDQEHLRRCDQIIVVMLDGWEESRGVAAEIDIARELGLPIDYVSPEMISNWSGGVTSISVRPSSQETSI
ncbi:MAG: DUF1937 family protein [Pirellulales bacterium]